MKKTGTPEAEDIVAINRSLGVAVTNLDNVIEVETWFDSDGNECEAEDAVVGIFNQNDERWWTVNLALFDPVDLI